MHILRNFCAHFVADLGLSILIGLGRHQLIITSVEKITRDIMKFKSKPSIYRVAQNKIRYTLADNMQYLRNMQ